MEQNRVYNTKPKKNLVTNELEHLKGKTTPKKLRRPWYPLKFLSPCCMYHG